MLSETSIKSHFTPPNSKGISVINPILFSHARFCLDLRWPYSMLFLVSPSSGNVNIFHQKQNYVPKKKHTLCLLSLNFSTPLHWQTIKFHHGTNFVKLRTKIKVLSVWLIPRNYDDEIEAHLISQMGFGFEIFKIW